MRNRNIRRRLQRRINSRGAAMIEGVIVITSLLVFMGLIVWTRNSYAMKLDLQQQTRSNVLYYSSHGCSGSNASSEPSGTVIDGDSPQAQNAAKKSPNSGKSAASRSYNTANAKATGTSEWQAVWDVNGSKKDAAIDLQKQKLRRPISAASKVTCNEKKYGSQWTAFYQFGVDFVSRGMGGTVDLFK